MTTVAVTAASSPLGAAVCARLAEDERVVRIIGIDVAEPAMPVGKLDFRVADLRDPVLSRAFDGADAIVHLGAWQPGALDDDRHYALVVGGTRNVLTAAAERGVSVLAHLSTAMVYGARDVGEMPLSEDADLHVDPDAARPYNQLLADELVTAFAEQHPRIRVATIRATTILGPGIESPAVRLLEAPRIPLVQRRSPVFQTLHPDDAASALHLAVVADLEGPYNAAADGWVTADEALSLVGRRALRLPEAPLMTALRAAHEAGLTQLTCGTMEYLMYPWVVDTSRLRAAGWRPQHTHREVLRAFAEEHGPWMRVGALRWKRRTAYGGAAFAAALAGFGAWKTLHDRRDRLENA